MTLLISEGGCRFTRIRKHNSCNRSQKERYLRFIQEKVQSCSRLYGHKDSDWTYDTPVTIYEEQKKLQLRQHALEIWEGTIQNMGNNRENDDAHYMFRSYNNCYYSSSESVSDGEDELSL